MKTEFKKRMGERIRIRRNELRISQSDLALTIGKKTSSYISYIEDGERNIASCDLFLLAQALDTTMFELLGESEINKTDAKWAIKADKRLKLGDRRKVIEYYEMLLNKPKQHENTH